MDFTPSIHWIGAGLASGPGIVTLAEMGKDITVWDMTLEKAESLQQHLSNGADLKVGLLNLDDESSRAHFINKLKSGDIIVSMLPATFHVRVAKLAISANCHMVTSSYLSDDMIALNDLAQEKQLSLVNEVGLDPGIDHLLTHIIIDEARKAGILNQGNTLDFISYCGGIPVEKTPFTYKFSWTPLGVLTALTNPAKMIKNGAEHSVSKAWEDVSELSITGEKFEVYPNRDSLPYVTEYGLADEPGLRTFVRGTLRLAGWKDAWQNIFKTIEGASPSDLKSLSDLLWQDYQYEENEEDRVVLHVALSATQKEASASFWTASLSLDCTGTGWKSAMASTVSLTVAEAIKAIIQGRLSPGVQAAPHDITEAKKWLNGLKQNGLTIQAENVDLTM